ILSGTLATMCPGVPYALAAKFAYPSRPVVACLGDGAMQMLGINGLIDIAKYADRFTDPRFVVLVLNNHDLNQVTWEQRVMEGDPKLEVSQEIPDFPYAKYAELIGLRGIKVDQPDAVGVAWDAALSADRPTLIEAVGAGAMAISAVDIALWDLKARLLGVSLCTLLGRAHEGVAIYGSGGFTSYADDQLASQLAGWAAEGIPRVKMKVGREPARDEHR